jgi:hypothetical protein
MSDPTSVLFGLEDEFRVLEVQRVDVSSVKLLIEQTAREGPCPTCGVLSGAVEGSAGDAAEGPAGLGADR